MKTLELLTETAIRGSRITECVLNSLGIPYELGSSPNLRTAYHNYKNEFIEIVKNDWKIAFFFPFMYAALS